MPSQNFCHLHVHTEGSFAGMKADGCAKTSDMISAAASDGFPAIAITDHGNMISIFDAYKHAREHEIKLIPGIEAYHVFDVSTMREKTVPSESGEDPLNPITSVKNGRFHITLLAINNEGLRNLFRIHEESWSKHFYYRPNVDFAMLDKYSEGIVCLTGCPLGMVQRAIRSGRFSEVNGIIKMFSDIYGDRLYAELQRIDMVEFDGGSTVLSDIADKLGIKKVATNDVHFIRKEDNDFHDIAICINKGMRFNDPDRKLQSCRETYLKSEQQMLQMFPDIPESVSNTLEIAERCNVDFFAKQNFMPTFMAPKKYTEENENKEDATIQYFKDKVKAGFFKVFPKEKWTSEYIDRLKYEVKIIVDMNFYSYHLIVADFIQWCKNNGIPVGPGRGSAAGSIVCASLGITDLDPIEDGLIFERYLNPGRKNSPPDIDTDVAFEHRQKVIDYVRSKYGSQRVAVIGTTGTFKPRMALKDVGRVLSLPDTLIESVSKCIPEDPKITFQKAIKESEKFKVYYDRACDPQSEEDYKLKELFKYAFAIEGNKRHVSKHAAGVVIIPENAVMSDFLPIMSDPKDKTTYTGLDMYDIEAIGLLKMDFLGLKTLDRIENTLKNAKVLGGYEWLKKNCDREDEFVYKAIFDEAETIGIFQFEKEGMRSAMRTIKVDSFSDLVMIVAAMRPGPKEFIPLMADCKHGLKTPDYEHPDLEPILRETYGVILYQEQALKIFDTIAGFTLAEADLARRAIGKKKVNEMEALREKFYNQTVERGYTKALAETLFAKIEKFAEYAFNKCLSGKTLLRDKVRSEDIKIKEAMVKIAENKNYKIILDSYCDGNIVEDEVVDIFSTGEKEIFEVTFNDGSTIECTMDHKFLTEKGEFKTLKSIIENGDNVAGYANV